MKKALITGGAGYIGHHLQKELKKQGYHVIVMDMKPQSKLMSDEYVDQYLQADIRDYRHILDEIKYSRMFNDEAFSFDVVFHLAGFIEVGESEERPLIYYENNVSGTINILRLMKDYGCDKIVFSSSCAAENPQSVYGQTKRMCETILIDAGIEGIKSVILRYFNVAGADPDGEFGENHDFESHLIPRILNRDDFTIYGNDYNTPDGTCIRDYIHVSDLAEVHVKAAEHLYENKGCSIFDIGSGTGYSVLDVLTMVEQVTGTKYNVKYTDRRPGDPAKLVCNPYWANEALKFKPKYGLEDIIKTAHQWEVIQRRTPNATIRISDGKQKGDSI
ncbi:MAG: UDP-glucose 4-epimerase GalE [Proteobacteria bacterium]|nr:UDP-glucose 4-epimerase GalE [Pseudomonadota bacterium]